MKTLCIASATVLAPPTAGFGKKKSGGVLPNMSATSYRLRFVRLRHGDADW